ncbi:copper resistance protein CopC [Micromonospora endolithica]|uniref:copper resistance CopC/CopD family protein n=1 Tax=Micromonospora endolithica TaxID=230091 RepID=UPI001EDE62C8|nr:copper resistance protein CopC [Micromonospora endolithica]
MRTRIAVLLGLVLALLCVPLAPASPAAAHAALVTTTPARDEVIGYAPREVLLTFSEPVTAVPGRVQVLAPDGRRITVGRPEVRDRTMRIPVRVPERPLGTYLVSYRVVSADSHPIAGSFVYSAGAPSATPPRPPDEQARQNAGLLLPTAKFTGYLGLVLAVGPTLLAATMWPRRRSRRGVAVTVYAGLALVAVATAGTWIGQAADTVGAPVGELGPADLRAVGESDVGVVLAARLALTALAAVLLPAAVRGIAGRGRVVGVVVVAVCVFLTWPLAGHPVAAPIPVVSVAAGAVHLAAMSVWLGGLLAVTVFLLRRTHQRVLARILPAWSRWATLAVGWLIVAGTGQAVMELGRPTALVNTPYGQLLIAKAALLAGVLAVAARQRRLVQRGTAAEHPRRVARAAGVELTVTAVVLALAAVLVQTPPGRTANAEAARADRAGIAQSVTIDLYTLQFDIYPAQAGTANSLHAFVYTPQGRALPVAQWTLSVALPGAGIEPIAVRVDVLEPNHGSAEIRFPVAGDWTLKMTARTTDIDQATVTATVTVR